MEISIIALPASPFLTTRLQFPERLFFPLPATFHSSPRLRATVAPAPVQAPDTLPLVDGFPHYVPWRLGWLCTVAWCSCTAGQVATRMIQSCGYFA